MEDVKDFGKERKVHELFISNLSTIIKFLNESKFWNFDGKIKQIFLSFDSTERRKISSVRIIVFRPLKWRL